MDCSLCNGTGRRNGEDCPVCGGGGSLERYQLNHVDLEDYALVDCPLCDGNGLFRGEDCPECRGEGKMERRYAERIEVSEYDFQECFICDGTGEWQNMPRRACGGEGRLESRLADQIDRGDYKMVNCPSCQKHDRDWCRTCNGEGKSPVGSRTNYSGNNSRNFEWLVWRWQADLKIKAADKQLRALLKSSLLSARTAA